MNIMFVMRIVCWWIVFSCVVALYVADHVDEWHLCLNHQRQDQSRDLGHAEAVISEGAPSERVEGEARQLEEQQSSTGERLLAILRNWGCTGSSSTSTTTTTAADTEPETEGEETGPSGRAVLKRLYGSSGNSETLDVGGYVDTSMGATDTNDFGPIKRSSGSGYRQQYREQNRGKNSFLSFRRDPRNQRNPFASGSYRGNYHRQRTFPGWYRGGPCGHQSYVAMEPQMDTTGTSMVRPPRGHYHGHRGQGNSEKTAATGRASKCLVLVDTDIYSSTSTVVVSKGCFSSFATSNCRLSRGGLEQGKVLPVAAPVDS